MKMGCVLIVAKLTPECVTDGISIDIVDKISYLGPELYDLNGNAHCVQRVPKASRAFFGLQAQGTLVKYLGAQPHIALEFYNTAIRKKNMNHLEKLQNNLFDRV